MELLGDGNAIYIRGAGAGNVIRRNDIHHLVAPMKMQSAIRTDGGQTDTLIAENLIYKCTSHGIILKLNNRCENPLPRTSSRRPVAITWPCAKAP